MQVFDEIKIILMDIMDTRDREITGESYLFRDLEAESVDLMELATALADRFKIEVNEQDVFLKGIGPAGAGADLPTLKDFPFLSEKRLAEILSDPDGGFALQVRDLVGYVEWQLQKA